ncbi:MAG: RNA methyltransferase [Anaerolineaceae bacterium]|nr:RNA methyltransferase [Anaerolineaceae bacterium]MDD4042836.1 RNA methyltransferase [Anaerolineaceae bacterium]MDD4578676.1 RNA methyltransferase [Anaerolineaceae bacterium]
MSLQTPIQSSQNSKVQLVRALMNQGKARLKQQAFVAEGVRLLEDGLRSTLPLMFVLYKQSSSARSAGLLEELNENGVDLNLVDDQLFDSLSGTEHSQGVLGVFQMRPFALPEHPDFLVVPDQLRDPGNLGTILRSAEAAGAQAVLLPPGNTDAFAPKVVRSGMGAHFRLPILHLPWDMIEHLLEKLAVFHADMHGEQVCWQANFKQPLALLIGGEAEGTSPEGARLATSSVRIPMAGGTESLNAAVSASLLMFEVARQRSWSIP